ncbi:DJ-1/PfpI family domain-containing protein [Ditylenchus destructor]|nr:DJ-1/PfpI family domain-containing protein [Ditylenchus destructor]
MAGPIKMVIGPAKTRLKDYLQDAKGLTDQYNPDDENFLVNVRNLKNRISRVVALLTEQNDKWMAYIQGLTGDDRREANEAYETYASGENNFVALMDQGHAALDTLEAAVDEHRLHLRDDAQDDDGSSVAIDLLKARYGNKLALAEALQAELIMLPKASEATTSLRATSEHDGVSPFTGGQKVGRMGTRMGNHTLICGIVWGRQLDQNTNPLSKKDEQANAYSAFIPAFQKMSSLQIAVLVFPGVQIIDALAPYDVFASIPNAKVHLVAKTTETLTASGGLTLTPQVTFDNCPALDVICVPGGWGVTEVLSDQETLNFVRKQAGEVRFLTSVCNGALILCAAGLLKGRRATTHWMCLQYLPAFGAIPIEERTVRDGNIFTGGGVTAGIDMALTVAAELVGVETAKIIQLTLEYAPDPPFEGAGSPKTAPPALVEKAHQMSASFEEKHKKAVMQAAKRLE